MRESKKQKAALGGGPARMATYEGVNLANMTKEVPAECVAARGPFLLLFISCLTRRNRSTLQPTVLPTTAPRSDAGRLPSRNEFFIEAKRQGRKHAYVDLDFSSSAAP